MSHPDENTVRADRAGAALAGYEDDGLGEDAVSDLLADLMHYCDANAIDFDAAVARAQRNHAEEAAA